MSDSCVRLTILHFNDVYEIAPVSGSSLGGLARVAALRQQLCQENVNTIVTFAGDLYNPSGLGKAMVAGEPLAGKQAVAVMNRVGLDYMTFGDHELNTVNSQQFAERIAAMNFKLVSSNIFAPNGQPFVFGQQAVLRHDIFSVSNQAGQTLRVGIFGLTKPIRLPQVEHSYLDWQQAAASEVQALRDRVDVLIALTHQPLTTDEALVEQFPAIDLVLGGDEHQHMRVRKNADTAPIYKADSNARSVYVIQLAYNLETRQLQLADYLQRMTADLPEEPETCREVNRWLTAGFAALRAEGWEPTTVVAEAPVDLDGFDATIRNRPTALTDLITNSMMAAAPNTELAIICSWAIRLDDQIPAGCAITTYDLIRLFYENSSIYAVEIPGEYLQEILDFGKSKAGTGSYLLHSPNVTQKVIPGRGAMWHINQRPLAANQSYRVAMADDLRRDYLFFINEARAREVRVVGRYTNLYQALVDQLQRGKKDVKKMKAGN